MVRKIKEENKERLTAKAVGECSYYYKHHHKGCARGAPLPYNIINLPGDPRRTESQVPGAPFHSGVILEKLHGLSELSLLHMDSGSPGGSPQTCFAQMR